MLYARSSEDGVVIGQGSKGEGGEASSSYLGELKGVCWALKETKRIVQGQQLTLYTVSESVYQRITRKVEDPKKMLDVRVSGMLGWVWANFLAERFTVKFVPREYNQEADLLSKWQTRGDSEEAEERRKECMLASRDEVLPVVVNANLDGYNWDLLHSGHMGLQSMWHKS